MELVTLSSGRNELAVEPDTGRLAQLKGARTAFIPRAAGRGPLRLHLPLPDFEAHMVEANLSSPSIEQDRREVRMHYADMIGKRGPTGVSAQVVIRSLDDGAFELTCKVQNRSDIAIPQVFFPCLTGFTKVDGETDTVMFGKSRFRPWQEWCGCDPNRRMQFMNHLGRPEFFVSANSPFVSGMKWMDYGGAEAGVSLFSREKTSSTQSMRVSTDTPIADPAETIDLSWFFYPFIQPGETWDSPVFVLYPHEGDWRRGVLRFKQHAAQTFTPVPTSPDRDATIGQQTLWISWHYQDWREPRHRFRDIPDIAAEARAAGFREMTIARATELDFCLPHKVREPLGTSEELKAAVAG